MSVSCLLPKVSVQSGFSMVSDSRSVPNKVSVSCLIPQVSVSFCDERPKAPAIKTWVGGTPVGITICYFLFAIRRQILSLIVIPTGVPPTHFYRAGGSDLGKLECKKGKT